MQPTATNSAELRICSVETTDVANVACNVLSIRVSKLLEGDLLVDLESLFQERAVELNLPYVAEGAYHQVVGMSRVDLDGNIVPNGPWEGVCVRCEIDWNKSGMLHVSLGDDNSKLTDLKAIQFKIMRRAGNFHIGHVGHEQFVKDHVSVESVHLDDNGDSQYTLAVRLSALKAGVEIDLNKLLEDGLTEHIKTNLEPEDFELSYDFSVPHIIGWSANALSAMPNFVGIPNFKVEPADPTNGPVIPLQAYLEPETHILKIQPIDPAISTDEIIGVYMFVERVVSHLAPAVATEQLSSTL